MNDPHHHSDPKPGQPPGAVPPPAPPEPVVEDAGSQALSEALRSSFVIVKVIMVILVVVFFASGFFTVSSQERAIVLRFGRPVGTGEQQLLEPGAHWSFPYPIDEVVKIPFSQFQTVRSTAGWYATTPEMEATNSEPPPGSTLNPAADSYTLTADGNIIHVRATMRYRINNPLNYALNFVNAPEVVQHALDNAIHFASAHFTVDQALTLDRLGFKEMVTERAKQLAAEQELGITVEQVDVRDIIPPRYVQPNFEAVLSAQQERRQTNELAQAYASRVRSTAVSEANQIINAAETDRTRFIQTVAAEAAHFTSQLPYYRQDPQLFTDRLRAETLGRILTNSTIEKFFVPQPTGGEAPQVWLQLGREPQKPAARPAP